MTQQTANLAHLEVNEGTPATTTLLPPPKGGVLFLSALVKGWDQWPLLRAETSTVG